MRPDAAATAAVLGGLALTGKAPSEAGHDAAGADSEEVAADVHLVVSLVGERAGSRRRLGYDDQRDDGGDRRHAAQCRPGQPRQPELRRTMSKRAQHRDAMCVKSERSDE